MNSLMFKKIWNLIYKATTAGGWNEPSMYGAGMILRIPTTSGHQFNIIFVGCRNHFKTIDYNYTYDNRQKGMKSFGNADEIDNVECTYTDREKVKEVHGDKETMEMDFNSDINDIYAVMDIVQIDWTKVINHWLQSDILISESFESKCSIEEGKKIRKRLKELISY